MFHDISSLLYRPHPLHMSSSSTSCCHPSLTLPSPSPYPLSHPHSILSIALSSSSPHSHPSLTLLSSASSFIFHLSSMLNMKMLRSFSTAISTWIPPWSPPLPPLTPLTPCSRFPCALRVRSLISYSLIFPSPPVIFSLSSFTGLSCHL